MAAACLYCGAPGEHRHHPTGRLAPSLERLDPALVIDTCRRCHVAEHQALRRLGLDVPHGDLLAHRVARVGAVALRCADLGRPFVLEAGPARAFGGLLLEVATAVAGREARAS